MRQTAAIGQQGLARVAVGFVLADRVFDGLAAEWVFEFGGEEWDAVEKQHQIEAVFVLGAVVDLADDGEEVGHVQSPGLFVEAARWAEIGEPERAAHVFHASPQDIECAASFDFG